MKTNSGTLAAVSAGALLAALLPAAAQEDQTSRWKSDAPPELSEFHSAMKAKLDAHFKDELKKAKAKVKELQREVARLEREINAKPDDPRKAKKQSALKSLRASLDAQKILEGRARLASETLQKESLAEGVYSGVKDTWKKIDELSKEWEQNGGSMAPMSFIPSEININELATSKSIRKNAVSAYQYYQKLNGLNDDIKKISNRGYSEATAKLTKSLTVLSLLMSEYGSKVPLIGDFIKGYGDVTKGFLDAIFKLEDKIKKNRNQVFSPTTVGTYGGGLMRQAWREQGIVATGMQARVAGLRDLYAVNHTELYLWDPHSYRTVGGESKLGRWWEIHKFGENGGRLNQEIILKRYKAFFRNGNKNPTAQQVLFEFVKSVELKLEAMPAGVAPEGTVELKPSFERVFKSDKPLQPTPGFVIYEKKNPTVKKSCKSGETVLWKMPKERGAHHLVAELSPEAKRHIYQIAPATVQVNVGDPTRLRLKVAPLRIPTTHKDPLTVEVGLVAEGSKPISLGELEVTGPPDGRLSQGLFYNKDLEQSKFDLTWTPYDFTDLTPGVYPFTAKYKCPIYEKANYHTPAEWTENLVVYEEITTRLQVRRRPAPAEGAWNLVASLYDVATKNPVEHGEITLSADKGGFLFDGQEAAKVTRPAGMCGVTWSPPDGFQPPAVITVAYPGGKDGVTKDFLPAETVTIHLPGDTSYPTKISATAKKRPGRMIWDITAHVTDAKTGKPVPAGNLEVTAGDGLFSSHRNSPSATGRADQALKLVWEAPPRLQSQSRLNFVYQETEHQKLTYQSSRGTLRLPKSLLVPTDLAVERRFTDQPAPAWTLSLTVETPDRQAVKVGRLIASVDSGDLEGGASQTFDLAQGATIPLVWRPGTADKTGWLTLRYEGDGLGASGENTTFFPCQRRIELAPASGKLRVTVIDADTAVPIPGVKVDIVAPDGNRGQQTDKDGIARWDSLPVGYTYVSVVKAGYQVLPPAPVEVRLGPDVKKLKRELTVRMVRGMTLSVFVQDEKGGLISKARLSVNDGKPGVAPSGAFTLKPLREGNYALTASARGYAESTVHYLADPAMNPTDKAVIVLKPGNTIGVEVRDNLNALIGGNISLFRDDKVVGSAAGSAALFDAGQPGTYYATASATNMKAGKSKPIVIAASAVPLHRQLVIKLEPDALTAIVRVSVNVTPSSTAPPGTVVVRMVGAPGQFMEADDVAVFKGVPPGDYKITARRPGYAKVWRDLKVAPTEPGQVYDVQLSMAEPVPVAPPGAGGGTLADALKRGLVASGLKGGGPKGLAIKEVITGEVDPRMLLTAMTMDRSFEKIDKAFLPSSYQVSAGPLVRGRAWYGLSAATFKSEKAARNYYEKAARAGLKFVHEIRNMKTDPEKDGGLGELFKAMFGSANVSGGTVDFHGLPGHLTSASTGGVMAQIMDSKGFTLTWQQGKVVVTATVSSVGAGSGGQFALIKIAGPKASASPADVYRLGHNLYREISLIDQPES